MNLNSFTIKKQLYVSFGLVMALSVTMGSVYLYRLTTLEQSLWRLGIKDAGKLVSAGLANGHSAELLGDGRRMFIAELTHNQGDKQLAQADYDTHEKAMRDRLDEIQQLGVNDTGLPYLNRARTALDAARPAMAHFQQLLSEHDMATATTYNIGTLRPLLKEVDEAGKAMVMHQRDVSKEDAAAAVDTFSATRWITGSILLLQVLVAVMVAWIITQLDGRLRRTAENLSRGATELSDASRQVSTASQGLARDTSEQAAMIEETSASAEEINSMARKNAENSHQSMVLVSEAVQHSDASNLAMQQCVEAMDALNESSSEIARIIEVIDKVAFQTNILALNAAVEAARAGEAGMGFAVVAEEVRNLAQRCAQAAQETAVLIKKSVSNTAIGQERIRVLKGSGEKVSETFGRLKLIIDEIGLSSQEQGKGVEQISTSISRMEQGTQKNAANAEESAAAAEELYAQSDSLRSLADELSRMAGINQTDTHASAVPSRPRVVIGSPGASKSAPRPVPSPALALEPTFAEF